MGHYHRFGQLLRDELDTGSKLKLMVQSTEGSMENFDLLRNGKVDLALVQGGLGHKLESMAEIRLSAIAAVGWQYVHIIVPKQSTINDFRDLKGKTISLGPKRSGNAMLGIKIIDYYWNQQDVQTLFSNSIDMIRDFESGKIDAFFAVYDLHAPIIEKVMNSGGYKLIPIREASSIAHAIHGCAAAEFDDGVYGKPRTIPNSPGAVFSTVKVKTYLLVGKRLNRHMIDVLLKTIFSAGFIKKNNPKGLSERVGGSIQDYPIHPAAKRFFNRNAPLTSDMYEIGSAYIALILFVAWVANFISVRRKNRELHNRTENIIPYFEEMVEVSMRLSETESIPELRDLLEEMMDLQRRAEKEWLHGKLDTEHMENLYSIYGIRCENIYNKMMQLQLQDIRESLNQISNS